MSTEVKYTESYFDLMDYSSAMRDKQKERVGKLIGYSKNGDAVVVWDGTKSKQYISPKHIKIIENKNNR